MTLSIFEIIVTIVLIAVILLQMQGSGLTSALGGTGESYRSKRSVEKILFYATIVLAFFFSIISILLLFPHR